MLLKYLGYPEVFTHAIPFYCYTCGMKSIEHINNALADPYKEVEAILLDGHQPHGERQPDAAYFAGKYRVPKPTAAI